MGLDCNVIAICNAKGGVGKTTTAINLSAALARHGERVLLIDNNPQQGSATCALGQVPDRLNYTLSNLLNTALDAPENLADYLGKCIIPTSEFDLIPANKRLSGVGTRLAVSKATGSLLEGNDLSSDYALKTVVNLFRDQYTYIIIDTGPSLDALLTVSLVAADQVIIPVQAHYLAQEGIKDILQTIRYIQNQFNPSLNVCGILLTMYQVRTNLSQDIQAEVREVYGEKYTVFPEPIAYSIRVAEQALFGKSIFQTEPHNPAALAYDSLAREVLAHG